MLFDLFPIAKVSIKIEYPNKFLLFIENLCFCSLKIAVCVPKIPIGKKKLKIPIRLKITIISKNYYLKIPVRVCICARMYVRVYACMIEEHRTHDQDRHTTGTHDHRKREEHWQHEETCMYV